MLTANGRKKRRYKQTREYKKQKGKKNENIKREYNSHHDNFWHIPIATRHTGIKLFGYP
jgi:hypothetical protein